jgi:hypothetical protein
MSGEARTVVISIRVRPDEAAHIDAAGRALHQPRGRADYVRAAALHAARAKVPPPAKPVRRPARRLPALDVRLLGQLLGQVGKMGSNLNQLARAANASGGLPASTVLAEMQTEISAIRARLTAALSGGDDGQHGDGA